MHVPRHRITLMTAAAAAGALLLAVGLHDDALPETIAGAVVTLCAAIAISLQLVHGWITDTAQERESLHTARLRTDDERSKYKAAHHALEAERIRLRRDAIAAGRRVDAAIAAERTRLVDEFEEQRAALIAESFETAWVMFKAGLLDAPPAARGRTVLPFPAQAPAHERARSRDASS